MDFLKVLQNKNFAPTQQETVRQRQQAPKPKAEVAPKAYPKKPTESKANAELNSYKVKSSKGKEFTRRRKAASSQYYDMDESSLLKEYDSAQTSGDDKKRKRVLYYAKKKGWTVRQLRRKSNGSE